MRPNMLTEESSQAALEYVLILGGAILLAAIVAVIMRNQVFSPIESRTAQNASELHKAINSAKQ